MRNSEVIERPDYYTLPDGSQLEDVIAYYEMDFYLGSALKYVWRAGRKDGESCEKDMAKADHYIRRYVRRRGHDLDVFGTWFMSLVRQIRIDAETAANGGPRPPWRSGKEEEEAK